MTAPARPHSPEPDPSLRLRFQQSNADAADALAVLFFDDVARFAHALLGDPELALDAAQETFLRVFELHRTFDPSRAFRPWLFGIARKCCMEVKRGRERRAARIVELEPGDDEAAQMASEVPSALEDLLRRELEQRAVVAVAGLTEEQREIVLLHLREDLTFREIAGVVQRHEKTVATIYYRTLAALRRDLESNDDKRTRGIAK